MSGIHRANHRPLTRLRKLEAKEVLFRNRKSILKYLVQSYLRQEGYCGTLEYFNSEAAVTGEFELCDNIDLDIILQDYISYYLVRFSKQPLFLKKVEEAEVKKPARRKPVQKVMTPELELEDTAQDLPSSLNVTQIKRQDSPDQDSPFEIKPLTSFLATVTPDKRPMAEMLYQDIIRPSSISWDDVQGLDVAKRVLLESVVYPVKYPDLFTGILTPWRGVLLHGPPGTGKTMLARATAADSQCTFFNVSCSSIVNKWRGESEKIVKVLFDMASHYSPSIIFIDEVETLASDRSSPGEHEASRRLKAQLLTELDGIAERDGLVFLLANSNMPWDIDPAMLRRLEKRIYIPLPDSKTRALLFLNFLSSEKLQICPEIDFKVLASKTEGYSGCDIKMVCKEALMVNVRKMLPNMRGMVSDKKSNNNSKRTINLSDLLTAIEKTKPVSKNLAQRHEEWQDDMGCS